MHAKEKLFFLYLNDGIPFYQPIYPSRSYMNTKEKNSLNAKITVRKDSNLKRGIGNNNIDGL